MKRMFSDFFEVPGEWKTALKADLERDPPLLGRSTLAGQSSVIAPQSVYSIHIFDGTITATDVNALHKDGLPDVYSMRTLGMGPQQAAPGNRGVVFQYGLTDHDVPIPGTSESGATTVVNLPPRDYNGEFCEFMFTVPAVSTNKEYTMCVFDGNASIGQPARGSVDAPIQGRLFRGLTPGTHQISLRAFGAGTGNITLRGGPGGPGVLAPIIFTVRNFDYLEATPLEGDV